MKDRFCSNCGVEYRHLDWPRHCSQCDTTRWKNPVPAVMVLQRVGNGLVVVRRGIEPAKGKWALPGGYIDFGETWQEAGARELKEETGIIADPLIMQHLGVSNSATRHAIMHFARSMTKVIQLPAFQPDHEVLEIKVIMKPEELGFTSHTKIVQQYFEDKILARIES